MLLIIRAAKTQSRWRSRPRGIHTLALLRVGGNGLRSARGGGSGRLAGVFARREYHVDGLKRRHDCRDSRTIFWLALNDLWAFFVWGFN